MGSSLDCLHARDLISARLDGEASAAELASLSTHLDSCQECQVWEARAHDLRRQLVLRHPLAPDDLADRVLARVSVPQRGAGDWIRYALAVVATALSVLNLPLVLGVGDGSDHDARHLGTFGIALGVGLLWAALRPERAVGLVPLALAMAVATLLGTAVDLGAGRTASSAEAIHVLELVGLGLLWVLSGGTRGLWGRLRPGRRTQSLRSTGRAVSA